MAFRAPDLLPSPIALVAPNHRHSSCLSFLGGVAIASAIILPWFVLAPHAAQAQPAARAAESGDDPSGRISAAEQRKEMIGLLKGLSTRVERLETTIARGISVKVTDMPAIRMDGSIEGIAGAESNTAPSPKPGIRSLMPGRPQR